MNKIIPMPDKILVQSFKKGDRKIGGIIVLDDDRKTKGIRPRWAQVYAVGSEVKEKIKVGEWVLIEHGRWSRGMEIKLDNSDEPIVLWGVDPNGIIGTSSIEPEDQIIGN